MSVLWVVGIALYLFVGLALFTYVLTRSYLGAIILPFWWVVVLFYPLLMIRGVVMWLWETCITKINK